MDTGQKRYDGLRSIRRAAAMQNKAELLDIIGLDTVTTAQAGFTGKFTRSSYDDEKADLTMQSPAGVYAIRASATEIESAMADSMSSDFAPMPTLPDSTGHFLYRTEVTLAATPAEGLLVKYSYSESDTAQGLDAALYVDTNAPFNGGRTGL